MREPYTPTTEQVREDFTTRMSPASDSTRRPAFDRWLEQERRKAAAGKLREVSRKLQWFKAQGNLVHPDTASAGINACIDTLDAVAYRLEREES